MKYNFILFFFTLLFKGFNGASIKIRRPLIINSKYFTLLHFT